MNPSKWLLYGAVILAVLVVVFVGGIMFARKTEAPATGAASDQAITPPASSSAPAAIPAKTAPPAAAFVPQVAPKPKSQTAYLAAIPVTSPKAGSEWVIGVQHAISWSVDAGVTSGIYLVDAANGATVGWITSSNGAHQTSYAWNTSEVYLERGSPTKKNLAPGMYIMKIRFDAPNRPDSTSGIFSVIYPSQAQAATHTVVMTNDTFLPSALAVTKGDKIVFQNNDSVTHSIKLASFSPFVIPAGQSYTFDTSSLSPGPYQAYSTVYSSMTMTITVQ